MEELRISQAIYFLLSGCSSVSIQGGGNIRHILLQQQKVSHLLQRGVYKLFLYTETRKMLYVLHQNSVVLFPSFMKKEVCDAYLRVHVINVLLMVSLLFFSRQVSKYDVMALFLAWP